MRFIAGLAVAHIGTAPNLARAQSTFEMRPTLSLSEVYESNLFASPAGARHAAGVAPGQEDVIARFTPGVESDYRAPRWTVSGRYSLDVERFAKHTDLTSAGARQHADTRLTYRATPRVRLDGGAEFVTTRSPQELNTLTALAFTRARSSRLSAHSRLTRELSPVTSGTLEYTFSRDRLGREFEAFTHVASLGAARRISARTQLRAGYRRDQYAFTTTAIGRWMLASQSLSVGAVHAISPRLTATIEAGPRLTGQTVRPELATSITWTIPRGDLSLDYRRTQATVFGAVGAADVQSVRVSFARTYRSVEVRLAPAIFTSALGAQRAQVYALSGSVSRRITSHLAVEMSVDSTVQYGNLSRAASETIPRHIATVRFIAAAPGRVR